MRNLENNMTGQVRPGAGTFVRLRRALVGLALVAGATVALGSAAVPASAVPNVRELSGLSAFNSTGLKSLNVVCPPFYHAVGGSAYIQGDDPGQVRIIAAVPNGADTSGSAYSILASEQEAGTGGNWRIVGTAVCAPAASLPGLEYQNANSAFNSAATNGATATCSAGKRLIGLGAEAWYSSLSDRSQVVLTGFRPDAAGTAVTATGFEDETGFSGNWRVHATAVCVSPVPGQQPVAQIVGYNSDPVKVAAPQCPTGTRVHSLGFDLSATAGQAHVHQLFIGGQAGSIRAVEDANGLTGSWRLRGYAICAN